jgi:putative ABC transport system permease protein
MQIAAFETNFVDVDYIKQYQIRMAAGRAFSTDFSNDSAQGLILNETAIKTLGYNSPQDALGTKFSSGRGEGKIIGVVKDFHSRCLQEPIQPLAMCVAQQGKDEYISIKVTSTNLPTTLFAIEKQWTTLIPYRPFNYFFADEYFDRQYRSENRFGKLFLNFALLAIIISCLGLFGLALTNTLQRAKEISIRKVLGASISGIIAMLTGDFLKPVILSIAIGSPIAWWAMNKWLDDFAYRVTIGGWVYVMAGSIAIIIALISISFQAIKTATANPVKNLRTE